MKYCTSCGAQLEDNAAFCVLCGTKQNATTSAAAPPSYTTPIQSGYVPQNPTYTAATPIVDGRAIVIKHGSSPWYLAAVIILCATTFIALINAIFAGSTTSLLFDELMSSSAYAEYMDMYNIFSGVFQATYVMILFISLIPVVLNVIGMFLFYKSCKNNTRSTAGLTILKVLSIISIVCTIVSLSILLLVVIVSTLQSDISVAIIIGIILLITFGIVLAYSFSILVTINRIRKAFITGEIIRTPGFLPVFLIILVVFSVFSIFTTFTILTTINTLLQISLNIILAKCLFAYNQDVNNSLIISSHYKSSQEKNTGL